MSGFERYEGTYVRTHGVRIRKYGVHGESKQGKLFFVELRLFGSHRATSIRNHSEGTATTDLSPRRASDVCGEAESPIGNPKTHRIRKNFQEDDDRIEESSTESDEALRHTSASSMAH